MKTIALRANEQVIIREARNTYFRVNESGVPMTPGDLPYEGDFLTPCAVVITADGQGMASWDAARQLRIGQRVSVGGRPYHIERYDAWDQYNVKLVPVGKAGAK